MEAAEFITIDRMLINPHGLHELTTVRGTEKFERRLIEIVKPATVAFKTSGFRRVSGIGHSILPFNPNSANVSVTTSRNLTFVLSQPG